MLFLVQNSLLTQNRERTFLTASSIAAATTFTVRAIHSNAWADNDWLVVGAIGTPNAEVLQVNGAVSNGTSLTVDNAGSGGARFAHAIDEPLYNIPYNQVEISRASTATGSKSVLATITLQMDDQETRYDDGVNTTGYGFVRFKNSQTGAFSPYSDAIPYDGQSPNALSKMVSKIRSFTDQEVSDFISDDEIINAINDKQRDILHERLWTFNETSNSTSSVQYQFAYDKPTSIKTLHSVRLGTWPLARIGEARFEMLNWDTQTQTSTPTLVAIFQDQVKVWPRPSAGANTTNLSAAISDSVTTIGVDDGGAFQIGDYYRFTIDDECIYATYYDSDNDQFTGCLRGQEGTTAASHLDNALVTERDLVYTGNAEAVDLVLQNDETIIPEPIVICYGVAADFFNGKLKDASRGDRYEKKYADGIEGLRNKYTLKLTSQMNRVKDPREVIQDNGFIRNPNNFPQNVIAPPLP